MKYFAVFDEENYLVARYIDEFGPVPKEAKEISKEDFEISVATPTKRWKLGESGSLISEDFVFDVEDGLYERQRLIAYADPVNGSDRYFAEALALQAEGFAASSSEVKELKQKGLARKEEIKLAYPKP